MICRSWCALFVLWLFVPIASASDSGLANPATKDFAEFRDETGNTGNFARRTSAFNERGVQTSQRAEPIRQVSAFGEAANDPFPMIAQPMPAQAAQHFSFDWGTVPAVIPNVPQLAQANVIPYDPNVLGYAEQQFSMQDVQNMYLAQQQFAQQQWAQQQFAQYPQQYHQGYMMPLADSFINLSMNPQADMYTQYGYADPYGGMWGQQMSSPMDYQNMPDHQSLYQAFLFQEMARRQAEEAQTKGSGENKTNEAAPQTESQWTLNNLVPLRVSSPLGETLLVGAKTISPFSTPPGPHKGVGMPLVNKSWLDHPYYAGGFVGYVSGSELVSGMIDQKSGGTGGFTFGYNFNDYWGLESRVHFASIDIRDTDYARNFLEQLWTEDTILPPATTRTNELTILDAAVHYYPLGNAKWRPYVKYGLGVGRQRFTDTFGYEQKADIVTMPLGVGMRYWWNERIALQTDLHNNMVFASGIAKTQHNVSFTVGLTYAFGSGRTKPPVHYWPDTPSMGSKW